MGKKDGNIPLSESIQQDDYFEPDESEQQKFLMLRLALRTKRSTVSSAPAYVKKQKECFSNINSSTPYDSCLCLSNSNFKLAKRNAYEWQICCPKFISKMTSRSCQTEKNFGFMDSCLADFIAVVECVPNNCDKFNCTTIYYFPIIIQLILCKTILF